MSTRRVLRRPLPIAVIATGALALAACLPPAPAPPPPPPKQSPAAAPPTTAPKPPPPPAPGQCQALETLSLESEAPDPEAYEAVVDDGAGGSEYVSFEAANEAEFAEQVAEIEATVGPVVEVGEQVDVGVLAVTPSDDPRYGGTGEQKAALDYAKFNEAWANGEDGAGVVVAVVDTGVLGNHQDLVGNLLPGADFVSSASGTCVDPYGHGTHVAGIVGQVDNTIGGIGGAPGVNILPVRVLGNDGSGSNVNVAAGIDWAVAHGAKVVNLSLGGGFSTVVKNAVDAAVAAGVVVVAAAGNCGNPSNLQKCGGLNAESYPAALANVIAVGALNTGQPARASFSNNNSYIDITAPGTSIDSSVPSGNPPYATKSGTSMATPFVSAVAALILRDCPLNPVGVLSRIQASATQVVSGFAETEYLVDAAAAASSCA